MAALAQSSASASGRRPQRNRQAILPWRRSPIRRSGRRSAHRIAPVAAVAVALQPARGGVMVLGRTREIAAARPLRAARWSARRARPADRVCGAISAKTMPASIGSKPQPAPAPPPDRKPQAAQRDQHQRRQRKGGRRRSPRPAGRRQSGPRQHHIDAPAQQLQRRSSSPNGIAATLSAAAGMTTKPITGMASRLPSTA